MVYIENEQGRDHMVAIEKVCICTYRNTFLSVAG